jgi:hypothetical protein
VSSLPATCNGGSATRATDMVVLVSGGAGKLEYCSATNTWLPVSSIPLGTTAQVPVMNAGATGYVPVTISQDAIITSLGAATVQGIETVPFCTGFTPTNGQTITYTTLSSPNPCWGAATPAGGFSPTITSPQLGQTINYNGAAWVNGYGGINVDPQTGSYVFGCPTDRNGEVEFNISAPATFSLPQAGGTACTQSNFALIVANTSSSTAVLTVTATTSTFLPQAVSSLTIIPGGAELVYSDATTGTGNYHHVPISTGFGGVNVQTSGYALSVLDKDKLVVMNCSSACIATLPNPPPSSKWNAWLLSIGSATATVSLNSLTFNGAGTAPMLAKGVISQVRTDGSNFFGDIAVDPFSAITSGNNNSAVMGVDAGASLTPVASTSTSNIGQASTNSVWVSSSPSVQIPPVPSLSFNATGGGVAAGTYDFVITFVGPSSVIPSAETPITVSGCGSSVCQIVVTMPSVCTSPVAPVTGCTVWDGSTGAEKQQAASNNCVNITSATCTVNTVAAGSTVTWPATTGTNPPNFVATTTADHVVPSLFEQKGDGNYYPLAGMDYAIRSTFNVPSGKFTFLDALAVVDPGTAIQMVNCQFCLRHNSGTSTTTGGTTDDRALAIHSNDSTTAPTYEQFLGIYTEQFASQAAFSCAPVANEDCISGGRFTAGDFRPANSGLVSVNGPVTGATGFSQRQTSGTSLITGGGFAAVGLEGYALNAGAGALNGAWFVGVWGHQSDGSASTVSQGASFYANATGGQFARENAAYVVDSSFSGSNSTDLAFDSTPAGNGSSAPLRFGGTLYLGGGGTSAPAAIQSGASTIAIQSSIADTGSISSAQLSTPNVTAWALGVSGGTGTSSIVYTVTCVDGNGNESAASSTLSTSNAPNNLTASNYIQITANYVTGNNAACSAFNIYRVSYTGTCLGGGCTNGKILTATPTGPKLGPFTAGNASSVNDQGGAGNGATAPTVNYTGAVKAPFYDTSTNCVSSASPAVCGSAPTGAVLVPTGATPTLVIDTTAVTATSRIFLNVDESLSGLGTCNSSLSTLPNPVVTARSPGVSVTITINATLVTNGACVSYFIVD